MGLFFERRRRGTNPAMPAIRDALRRTVAEERVDQVAGAIAQEIPPAEEEVAPKPKSLILGVGLVIALFAAASVLALLVDPQLIAEAKKVVDTEGYESPELQLKLLSDAVRNLLITAAGGLTGLIVGDAVGTATSGGGTDAVGEGT